MSEELKRPKDLPKVISLGVLFVVLVYAIFNIAVFRALPLDTIVASSNPAADAAVALFGKNGAMFISAGIMISVFGALNGFLMTGARIPFAMLDILYNGCDWYLYFKKATETNGRSVQSSVISNCSDCGYFRWRLYLN